MINIHNKLKTENGNQNVQVHDELVFDVHNDELENPTDD
jgi:DNA polymerase I-like protein with 3'-5' exonuclease and polymerase domains